MSDVTTAPLEPGVLVLLERAKRAIVSGPEDPRTLRLAEQAAPYLDRAPAWQDVASIRSYSGL